MSKIRTIDLFAGIGGIRKGFEMTGRFTTVFANDFDKNCKVTYDANFSGTTLTVKNIYQVSVKNGEVPEFDFLLGGFPCQAFSAAGYRLGLDDHKGRGILFEQIERILQEADEKQEKKPLGFLLENVKALRTHDGGRTLQIIHDRLKALGYHIEMEVFNSADYGVAQNRERIYIVGFRDKAVLDAFEWPKKTVEVRKHIREILDQNVPEKYYYNGKPLHDRIKDDVVSEDYVYQYRRNYVRANKKGLSPTLMANMGTGGHNVPIVKDAKGIRKLTPRECAKLQGYDDLIIPEILSDGAAYKQLGNSVTVPVMYEMAKQIAKAIDTVAEGNVSEVLQESPLLELSFSTTM